MSDHGPPVSHVRELAAAEVDLTAEAEAIQARALQGQASVIRLGDIVLFSSASGDAWMLDPEDQLATCIASAHEPRPLPIEETASRVTVQWDASYAIEQGAFTVVEGGGKVRTIVAGYPLEEIERLSQAPGHAATAAQVELARERLQTGRNEPDLADFGNDFDDFDDFGDELDGEDEMELDVDLPPEVLEQIDALWDAQLHAVEPPSVAQMDAFVDGLLALPVEATSWNKVFNQLVRGAYPDLPRVFRRIADAVPGTEETQMGFFYWAAAAAFARAGPVELLAEVAARFRGLDCASYDPDALDHVLEILLAEGREGDALDLAEHFLPVMRADDSLMAYAVPETCDLIFNLRQGRALREGVDPEASAESVARDLSSGMGGEIHADAARNAAAVLTGEATIPAWSPADLALPALGVDDDDDLDDEIDEQTWRAMLRLNRMLLCIAREAWEMEQRPPGSTLYGLCLLRGSLYERGHWPRRTGGGRGPNRRAQGPNLLDALRPAGLEKRLVGSCRDIVGMNAFRARLMLDACEMLLHAAKRHTLISAGAAARTAKEIHRLHGELGKA